MNKEMQISLCSRIQQLRSNIENTLSGYSSMKWMEEHDRLAIIFNKEVSFCRSYGNE